VTRRTAVDTNVLVSGLGWSGPPAEVVDALLSGRLQLVTSEPLLSELWRVLDYPRLASVVARTGRTAAQLVDLIREVSVVAAPVQAVAVARDTADNRLLEAALAGSAEMIVSGDEDLLVLRAFQGIPILTPTAALSTIRGTE
jgi:putative PIN family toxin of toxin-antitoxin system